MNCLFFIRPARVQLASPLCAISAEKRRAWRKSLRWGPVQAIPAAALRSIAIAAAGERSLTTTATALAPRAAVMASPVDAVFAAAARSLATTVVALPIPSSRLGPPGSPRPAFGGSRRRRPGHDDGERRRGRLTSPSRPERPQSPARSSRLSPRRTEAWPSPRRYAVAIERPAATTISSARPSRSRSPRPAVQRKRP